MPRKQPPSGRGRAAKAVQSIKKRVQRLEEARAASPPLGSFASGDQILSPISRVVDRATVDDSVTVTVETEATSFVIDDFEDQDASEYTDEAGNSPPGGFYDFDSHPVQNGSYSFNLFGTTSSDVVYSTPGDGLNAYPASGDTFRGWLRPNGDGAARLLWGTSDGDNTYFVELDVPAGSIELAKRDNGSETSLDSTSVAISQAWYELEVAWDASGTTTVTLFDDGGSQLAQLSTTDSTFTDGGVGFASYDAVDGNDLIGSHFDFVRVTTLAGYIDDFEDDDLAEYSVLQSDGTGASDVQISTKEHGSYALELDGLYRITSLPGDGLANYPGEGDTFEAYHYLTNGALAGFIFGAIDTGSDGLPDDYMVARIDQSGGTFSLESIDAGFTSQSTSITVPTSEWLRVEIEWQTDGTVTARLFDSGGTKLAELSATTSLSPTSAGVGWEENS